ncbi:hypothetical protein BJ085DRAFT_27483 [Dimargaris cristalligena]|uniref:Uncharacterized protein n=1 Tax=Dimargaris cristalligena TaxID=215637 RepID=A0A4Q0A0N5_9FUNG|nr:hypothetical protein BJ085DRAFT_27483 [Dimargaris cristalligena]|eukprot:RKP38991.1 hypothetical protein BJ085DRAFT_27483 [Dimargaris cristalligena]
MYKGKKPAKANAIIEAMAFTLRAHVGYDLDTITVYHNDDHHNIRFTKSNMAVCLYQFQGDPAEAHLETIKEGAQTTIPIAMSKIRDLGKDVSGIAVFVCDDEAGINRLVEKFEPDSLKELAEDIGSEFSEYDGICTFANLEGLLDPPSEDEDAGQTALGISAGEDEEGEEEEEEEEEKGSSSSHHYW